MSRNKKINIKMKNDLVLVSIFLTTILLINTAFSQNSGGAGIYWDHINKKLTLESTVVEPGPPPRTIPLQPATGQNMLDNPEDAYKHWDSATVQQRIDYVEKKFPGLKITGDVPSDFKLRPDGLFEYKGKIKNIDFNALIDKAGGDLGLEFTRGGEYIKTPLGEYSVETVLSRMEKLFPAQTILNVPQGSVPKDSAGDLPGYRFAQGGGSRGGGGFEQVLSLIQQLAGLAKEMRSNGKGETRVEEGKDGKLIAQMEKGAAISLEDLEDNGKSKLLVAQNKKEKKAELKEKGDKELDISNANILIPEQLAASVDDETTLVLNGEDGDSPTHPPQTYLASASLSGITNIPTTTIAATSFPLTLLSFPLFNINYFIGTGKVVAEDLEQEARNIRGLGQSIELLEHDLNINGHKIDSYALKTFNNLEVGGQKVTFSSGDLIFKFNNQQTLISRTFPDIPYGVKQISNKLDRNPDNKFTLNHYTNRKGNFHNIPSENQRVSFSDITTNPQSDTYGSLVVWEGRKEWWKK